MKKVIPIVIGLFMLCLIYEFFVLILFKKYDYSYIFKNGKNSYKVDEIYRYNDGKHLYNIKINYKKNNYIYLVDHNYHKNKGIIEDIFTYSYDGLDCVMPVFKDKVTGGIQCNKDGKVVSYDYLVNTKDERISNIKSQVEKAGYKLELFVDNENTRELKDTGPSLRYYTNFIPNYNVVIWEYKGVFSINKDKANSNEFLNFDVYDSKYTIVTDEKMYVMNVESKEVTFDKVFAVKLEDGTTTIIDMLDTSVSSNCYFNGVYDGDIYFMDCNSDTQYKINEKSQEMEVTSKENKIKYFDGKELIDKKVDSLSNNNIKFNTTITNDKISELYGSTDIRLSNNHYYFRDNEGNIRMTLDSDYKNSILLFKIDKFTEWKVVNDTVFGISGDTLYAYNNNYGLKPLVKYNEFNYRTVNMYGVVEK